MKTRNVRSLILVALLSTGACTAYVRPGGAVVYIHRTPPPLRIETRGPAPSRAHVWVDGRWDWRGEEYVWVAGSWSVPESGRHQWVAGSWHQDRNGWFWVEGHWR